MIGCAHMCGEDRAQYWCFFLNHFRLILETGSLTALQAHVRETRCQYLLVSACPELHLLLVWVLGIGLRFLRLSFLLLTKPSFQSLLID